MSNLAVQDTSIEALNNLIMGGDMSKLSPKQKLDYYHAICTKIGLNPLTKPFDYMRLNGKEVLYANKGAAEQIRNIRGISVTSQHIEWADDIVIVTVEGRDRDGRTDTETGFAQCVNLKGDAKGNALLKAITKAKRRLTLSMAGLGMLDETEVDSIPTAIKLNDVTEHGEVIEKVKPIHKHFTYVEPFKISIALRNDKPDWAKWFRDYTAHLSASPPDRFDDWLELNKDAYANAEFASPANFEKLSAFIGERVSRIQDSEILEREAV